MSRPERKIPTPYEAQTAYVAMASKFSGSRLPNTAEGFVVARNLLGAQARQVRLALSHSEVRRLVAEQAPVIAETKERVLAAITASDLPEGVNQSNFLHTYAEIDDQDRVNGEAVLFSLQAHRVLSEAVANQARLDRHIFLRAWSNASRLIAQAASSKNVSQELSLRRGLIHLGVVEGVLGNGAKRYFDPSAVIRVR